MASSYSFQAVVLASHDVDLDSAMKQSCQRLWDPAKARFSPCALPYMSIIPLVIILLIALIHLVSASPHFRQWRPKWAKPFIGEPAPRGELDRKDDKVSIFWTIALVACSMVAIVMQIVKVFQFPGLLVHATLQLISWTIVALVLALTRPRYCPTGLMAFYIPSIIVEAAGIGDDTFLPSPRNGGHELTILLSFTSAVILLAMPMRVECKDCGPIAKVGAAPSSADRTPEDALRLWQFLTVSWVSPLLRVGSTRQLQREDIWRLPYTFQSGRLAEAIRDIPGKSIIWRLVRANAMDCIALTITTLMSVLCSSMSPILLHQLLVIMESPNRDNRAAMVYALISFAVRIIDSQNSMLALWYGRRCYERARGQLIMILYQKVLVRKVIISQDKEKDSNGTANGATSGSADGSGSARKKATESQGGFAAKWHLVKQLFTGHKEVYSNKGPASTGQVLNLVRSDAYDLAELFLDMQQFVKIPIGLIFTIYLIWWLLGPSCFLAVAVVIIGHLINILLARIQVKWRRFLKKATDARVQQSSQFIESLRNLRWYGWQEPWLEKVMAARRHELNIRLISMGLNLTTYFISVLVSNTFPVIAFFAYTSLAGHELRIDLIFPALQLFGDLQMHMRSVPQLIKTYLNALVSIERMDSFLNEFERENISTPPTASGNPAKVPPVLKLERCNVAWPGTTELVLQDVNLTIEVGLTVVTGKVASGKSALLQTLLGEVDLCGGRVDIPDEPIGYCPQTPWLQSMSVRDNILFHTPYDELDLQRYKAVLDACALLPDLASFQDGDESHIGENGIGLSGGQRARVSLARALYSRARILLLDDPLSALDHDTAESIIRKVFTGSLVEGRAVVLVTHRPRMVQRIATQFVKVSDGRLSVFKENPFEGTGASTPREQHTEQTDAKAKDGKVVSESQVSPFIEDEKRESGGIKSTVWLTFFLTAKWFWLFLAVMLTLTRVLSILKSWFYKSWGEAYARGTIPNYLAVQNFAHRTASDIGTLTAFPSFDPGDYLPAPQDDLKPWLVCLFVIAVASALSLLGYAISQLMAVYATGKNLYAATIKRVTDATFRFYDVTPTGRILNRLTSDISVLDNALTYFGHTIFYTTAWIMSVAVIASVSPSFLILAAVLMFVFVLVFRHFLPTSRNLKRLEKVSLSPLYTHFGELLQSQGLTTVRAFHAQMPFTESATEIVDQVQGYTHFYWSAQNWLMYRYQNIGATASFLLTACALLTHLSPGMTAFMLSYAWTLITATHTLCLRFGKLQTEFISVERIVELLNVELEPPGTRLPPASWPRFGAPITFRNVTVRYAPHLDPSLKDITLSIPGGRITAIIGRTGSGKSTLALALLNIVRAETGAIEIDGESLSDIDVATLRHRVTFIPQEPVLFDGTIYENLDPVDEFDEAACAAVLDRIASSAGQQWALGDRVEAGGHNFSQGQRQLLGLTRAVLRRSPIVILDEATASIDIETAMMLQAVIREEMKEATVLMVAHRVEAVRGADYAVVLEDGRVKRQGAVGEVLAAESGIDETDEHGEDGGDGGEA